MSGKGTEIGAKFEELKAIRDGVLHPERIGICLDTCHVYAAGYDIVENLDGVLEEFDRILGLDLLRAIHLNDSMMPFGSHKDRHAVIGGGEIGMDALLRVIRHPRLRGIPFYLETPLDDRGHKEEIAKIKSLLPIFIRIFRQNLGFRVKAGWRIRKPRLCLYRNSEIRMHCEDWMHILISG